MKTIIKQCLYCQKDFEASLREHKRGNAKYCCKEHFHKANSGVRKIHLPNVTCAFCSVAFYKSEYSQSKAKSGLFFCCKDHKDKGQMLDFGLTDLHPDHYGNGNGIHTYREKALNHYGAVCSVCSYDKHPIVLQVHHIDIDRNNNHIDNLQVVCPTCHCELHYLSNSGLWYKTKKPLSL